MTKAELQRLKALEDENRRLKRMVADQALNIQVLKDALKRCDAARRRAGRPETRRALPAPAATSASTPLPPVARPRRARRELALAPRWGSPWRPAGG
ncbi:MAG: hypothetical protein IPO73_10895 [Gemmatimonadetes bacterium]|nr:hypothetical protein [Gemmatimonadota bacterium]